MTSAQTHVTFLTLPPAQPEPRNAPQLDTFIHSQLNLHFTDELRKQAQMLRFQVA